MNKKYKRIAIIAAVAASVAVAKEFGITIPDEVVTFISLSVGGN